MKMEVPSKEKVFITGIDGFTGVHLERELFQQGYQVFGSTYKPTQKPNHFQCNILVKDELKYVFETIRPDYLIHLAAISFVASENIPLMYETNILGTLNVLDVLVEQNIMVKKIIVASSAAIYGNIGSELSEDMLPKPVNHYGNSKLAMENMVANYFPNLNIIITRPFNYTGIGQESNFLIPKIISHFKQREGVIELGNINTYREYNDVKFITEIYLELLRSEYKSGVVNVCSGKTHCINDIIKTMEEITNHSIEVRINNKFVRKNEIKELKGSTTLINKILSKNVKSYSLNDTLREMYLN